MNHLLQKNTWDIAREAFLALMLMTLDIDTPNANDLNYGH